MKLHETAEQEITQWLDTKRVFQSVRTRYIDSIETLIDAVCEGVLERNPLDNSLTHHLLFPIQSNANTITQLKYRSLLPTRVLAPYLKGVNVKDSEKYLLSIIGAICNTPRNIIAELDLSDKKISQTIAIFYI